MALMVPPLPAPSRPSKMMQTLRPLCTTHCWSLTSSTCSRASSRSYSFRFSLPFGSVASFFPLEIGSLINRILRTPVGDITQMYQNADLLAAYLLIYSEVAGRIERSLISGPIVFTVAGFILGADLLGVLRINITGEGLRLLAELTLAMVLFTDAANADFGVVRRNLGLPGRLLGIGLPLTILLGFLFAAIVFPSLDIVDMGLLAAMLAPTDAALGKPVVTNQAVPVVMREALNLESGLNDGICVPIVVILLGLAVGTHVEGATVGHVVWVVAEEIGIGAMVGLA